MNPIASKYKWILSGALLLLIAGCSKDGITGEEPSVAGEGIRFQAWSDTRSRALAINTGEELAAVSDVKVTALRYAGSWAALGAPPSVYINASLRGTTDTYGVTTWNYLPVKDWPGSDKLAFFATAGESITSTLVTESPFYPSYSVTAANGELDVNDIMVSAPILDRMSGDVELQMNHILARVGFSFKLSAPAPGGADVVIADITISGWGGDTFNNAVYAWSADDNKYTWDYTEGGTYAANTSISCEANSDVVLNTASFQNVSGPEGYFFFIPQDISTKELTATVTYSIDGQFTTATVGFEPVYRWEEGIAYNYNVTLTPVTPAIIIEAGGNYVMDEVCIDAHHETQPLYLSAKSGIAKISISEGSSFATISVPSSEAQGGYTLQGGAIYVSFADGLGSSYIDRQIQIDFADNAPATDTIFYDRQAKILVEFYEQAAAIAEMTGEATETIEFPYLQSAPYYVGGFGGYDATQGYTRGLIMEQFEEYDIEVFNTDAPLLKPNGLVWWNGPSGLLPAAFTDGDYNGSGNTAMVVTAGDGASNAGIAGLYDARFNTYAAKYCSAKGDGWYLPAPIQMRLIASYANSAVGPIRNAAYWTSLAVDGSNAVTVTKSGTDAIVNKSPGAPNVTLNHIRCVKEIPITISKPANTVSTDGTNVSVDTGGTRIILSNDPGTKDGYNFSNLASMYDANDNPCPKIMGGKVPDNSWRLASAAELIYLYSINMFIPASSGKKMTHSQYWVTEKSGGMRGYVEFVNGVGTLNYTNTGSFNAYVRCVQDAP